MIDIVKSETWENQYGKIEVYPDISNNIITQIQYCNITSYIDDTEIDLAFKFDFPLIKKDIWIWKNISHNITIIDYGYIQNNYTLCDISNINIINNPEYIDFGDIPSNFYYEGYINSTYTIIGFDSFEWLNDEHTSAIFYYEYWGKIGYHIEEKFWYDWYSIKYKFQYTEKNNSHYYHIRELLIKNKIYKLKWSYDVPLGSNGKWDLLMKKSSDPMGEWKITLDPWWNSSWNFYKKITIESDYIEDSLINFPVLVNSTDIGMIAKCDNGDSVRFISLDNITEFNYEIEKWSFNNFSIWVNISEIIPSGSDYTFLMYYGNSGASDNQNPTGVWDSHYKCVYHMNETSGNIIDSTINANTGTQAGFPNYSQIGKIGDCIAFNGSTDWFLDILPKEDLPLDSGFLEFWVKPDIVDADEMFFGVEREGDNDRIYFGKSSTVTGDWRYGWGTTWGNLGTPTLSWQYNQIVISTGNIMDWYIDTNFLVTRDSGSFVITTDYNLGVGTDILDTYAWDGLIDETRISDIPRNNSWRNASFHTMNRTKGFMIWGIEIGIVSQPDITFPYPVNSSIGIYPVVTIGITIGDKDNEIMNIIWYTNLTGNWVQIGENHTDKTNGSYYKIVSNFELYNTTYYWMVNVTKVGGSTSRIYHLTTAIEPCEIITSDDIIYYALIFGILGGFLGGLICFYKRRKE